jgi:dTDP-4-amino-4,6-dideoxygalactose transaminase
MFDKIIEFEKSVADFYGAPYAVATDCCTHAVELCLRINNYDNITVPAQTYLSIPMTLTKLNINWRWRDEPWADYYYLGNTNIIDSAVYWKERGYIPNTFMCLSFQFKKHLSLGRGGMILLDNLEKAQQLKCMTYDGRTPDCPWTEQDIKINGFHYYLMPELAVQGLEKLPECAKTPPKKWSSDDYPYLPNMTVFKNEENLHMR